jgi:S-formylglutathione hydrolase
LPEGLISLSKHACFGGAVSFHEHSSETCDATMRFAVYAPPRRVLDPAVAQEEQI